MNTHYIRTIAEAVTEYNKLTNIRFYYDCASTKSAYRWENNWFTYPMATDYKIKAMHKMGKVLGFCNEHQRPDRPQEIVIENYMEGYDPANYQRLPAPEWYNRRDVTGYRYDTGLSCTDKQTKSSNHIIVLICSVNHALCS